MKAAASCQKIQLQANLWLVTFIKTTKPCHLHISDTSKSLASDLHKDFRMLYSYLPGWLSQSVYICIEHSTITTHAYTHILAVLCLKWCTSINEKWNALSMVLHYCPVKGSHLQTNKGYAQECMWYMKRIYIVSFIEPHSFTLQSVTFWGHVSVIFTSDH